MECRLCFSAQQEHSGSEQKSRSSLPWLPPLLANVWGRNRPLHVQYMYFSCIQRCQIERRFHYRRMVKSGLKVVRMESTSPNPMQLTYWLLVVVAVLFISLTQISLTKSGFIHPSVMESPLLLPPLYMWLNGTSVGCKAHPLSYI